MEHYLDAKNKDIIKFAIKCLELENQLSWEQGVRERKTNMEYTHL